MGREDESPDDDVTTAGRPRCLPTAMSVAAASGRAPVLPRGEALAILWRQKREFMGM